MSGFVFQEIFKHTMQNPAHTLMHEAVAKNKKMKIKKNNNNNK